ncbi:RNA-directed DNA polymerase [Rothia sp. ZJ932]|uniref:RNA-directed DNA polymerase n=1 Tax=Rothia sp. ZJ932 TaxID=2810516 RepID=UPI0019679898|nr:RNA-directed DNA polymerase [Rothia sp. ZJ932]QRZ62442.1 RNA-directed DNA polymerase [Rothia sp. ZJ932]
MYSSILNTKNLVKYGYYQIPRNKPKKDSYGSLDAIYSPLFNLNEFYKWIELELEGIENGPRNLKDVESSLKLHTEAIEFTIAKSEFTRRLYKYPNLYSYVNLAKYIEIKKEYFSELFIEDVNSTSKYFNSGITFNQSKNIEQSNLQIGKKILSLDLSNFYHTLYTHSIEWMLHEKSIAKANRSHKKSDIESKVTVGKYLDILIQNCQYKETHGLPTGTMVSQVISEAYMAKFDQKMRSLGNNYFSRYVDDFKFAFNSEAEKEKFLVDFHKICNEHGIFVNSQKTQEYNFDEIEINSKSEIFKLINDLECTKSNKKLRIAINNIIDIAVYEQGKGNKGTLKYLFSCLKLISKKSGWEKAEKIFFYAANYNPESIFERLLDLSVKNPEQATRMMYFTNSLKEHGVSKKTIKKVSKKYFKKNATAITQQLKFLIFNKYSHELLQLLTFFVEFKIKFPFPEIDLDVISASDLDDFNLIMLIALYRKSKDYKEDQLVNLIYNIFEKVDKVYSENNLKYMTRAHWLLRYYVFYLFKNYEDLKSACDDCLRIQKVKKNSSDNFQSGIDSGYVFSCSSDKVTVFYKNMLDFDIRLFSKKLIK